MYSKKRFFTKNLHNAQIGSNLVFIKNSFSKLLKIDFLGVQRCVQLNVSLHTQKKKKKSKEHKLTKNGFCCRKISIVPIYLKNHILLIFITFCI